MLLTKKGDTLAAAGPRFRRVAGAKLSTMDRRAFLKRSGLVAGAGAFATQAAIRPSPGGELSGCRPRRPVVAKDVFVEALPSPHAKHKAPWQQGGRGRGRLGHDSRVHTYCRLLCAQREQPCMLSLPSGSAARQFIGR